MCGIVGYVGKRPVLDVLIRGLSRLEYRGYDSAGVAFFQNGDIKIKKSEGKLVNVEKLINGERYTESHCGIGHTRWATHGKPTTQNAHPHQTGVVVLVHNGIIENYLKIKADLKTRGITPQSETDSELFGFLVLDELEKGETFPEAVRKAFLKIEGGCSVVVMSQKEPDLIVGVRNGTPLVAAVDPEGGSIVASDAQAILEYSQDVVFLDHGEMVIGDQKGLQLIDLQTGKPNPTHFSHLDWTADKLDKQGYDHYMLKEIHEQPQTIIDTLNNFLDRKTAEPFPLASQPGVEILKKADHITLIACGTAWHSALLGKNWIEKLAKIPVSVELASEFRYRDPVIQKNGIVVGVSQSGETADTLACINDMRKKKIPTIGLTNVRGSTLSREADATFFMAAGPEIGVAATKTFTAQMLSLYLWAGFLGIHRGACSAESVREAFEQIIRLPHVIGGGLQEDSELILSARRAADHLWEKKAFFFIGRGYSFPLALEGALKLKEIAYIPAEGYAAGELKHGPIAMIDEEVVLVALAPQDRWQEKTISNIQEVKARGATVLGIGHPEDNHLKSQCDEWIPIPKGQFDESVLPFLVAPAIQLLSYEIALRKGTEIDQPRNLAKSVTVE